MVLPETKCGARTSSGMQEWSYLKLNLRLHYQKVITTKTKNSLKDISHLMKLIIHLFVIKSEIKNACYCNVVDLAIILLGVLLVTIQKNKIHVIIYIKQKQMYR